MAETVAVRIQWRRGTAAYWATSNPVLLSGEIGWESDTGKNKMGDGTSNWNTLTYNGIIGPPGPPGAAGADSTVPGPAGSNGVGVPVGGTANQVLAKIDSTNFNTQWVTPSGGGSVTSVSVVTANGVSGSVATATTTPAITLTLGAITPSSVVASGSVTGSNLSGTHTGTSSGTNTGDQSTITGNAGTATAIAGGTANQRPYQTGAGATSFYSSANYGVTVSGATGVPQTIAGAAGVLVGSASAIPAFSTTPTLTGTNFTGIPNAGLTNSSLTIGSTSVSLGATVTTFTGLTSVTSTTFVGALTGNASTATSAATLTTPRAINGTNFDGSAAITVTAAAGTLTGATLNSGVTASSLTSVGTLANLTVTNPIAGSVTGNAATVTTNANLTGDVTSSGNATTLATVNANVGSFTNANITVNAKGLITAASNGSGGGGGLTNPIAAGTAAAPSINFASATTSGFYSAAANTVAVAANGYRVADFLSSGTAVNYLTFNSVATTASPFSAVEGSDTNITFTHKSKGFAGHSFVTNVSGVDRQLFIFGADAAPTGAMNYPQFSAVNAGSYPYLQASGGDTNIGFDFYAKGNANIRFQSPTRINSNLTVAGTNTYINIVAVTADPSTPASGTVNVFSKEIAGEGVLRYQNDDGQDYNIQRGFSVNNIQMCLGGMAAPSVLGGMAAVTATNTTASAALASTNLATSILHSVVASTATAGTLGTNVSTPLRYWRGNAAGLGGYTYTERFSLLALQTGMRCFVGLADSATALTNVDYTTATTPGKIGMAIIASTGNWSLVHNLTGAAPTIIALGANFPVNTTDVQELTLYAASNGSGIGYRVRNLSTGNETSGTITTNQPANTTFLCPSKAITNNATAAVASMRFYKWTVESDN